MLGGIDLELISEGIHSLEERKRVRVENLPEQDIDEAVFLMHFYRFEREICNRLHGLISHPSPVSREKVGEGLPKLSRAV